MDGKRPFQSLRNFFKHQPWDLLMFVDEFTTQFDYLVVLRSPYDLIDEENLERIVKSDFKCGCLVSWKILFKKNFVWNIRLEKSSYSGTRSKLVTSKCNIDMIFIFFENFVDLRLVKIPSRPIIDSHNFIVFMKLHPSSTTKWNIFHSWKMVSIFINLESVLCKWPLYNSVCIGLELK